MFESPLSARVQPPRVVGVPRQPVLEPGARGHAHGARVPAAEAQRHLQHHGVVAVAEVDPGDDALLLRQRGELLRLVQGHGERLLREDVLPPLDGRLVHGEVQAVGRARVDHVDRRVGQDLGVVPVDFLDVVLLRRLSRELGVGVRDAFHRDPADAAQGLDVDRADVAGADDRDIDHCSLLRTCAQRLSARAAVNSFTFWSISASVECGWMPNADPRPRSTTPTEMLIARPRMSSVRGSMPFLYSCWQG